MNYILLSTIILYIISCGSSIKTEDLSLKSYKTQLFCSIETEDEAWQQGHYVAKSLCEQGTLGELRALCSPKAQETCISGILAYLKNSPCNGSTKLHNPDIHRIMCPLSK